MISMGNNVNRVKVLMVGNHPSVKGGITSVVSQLLAHDWSKDDIDMRYIPTYIETNFIFKITYFLIAYFKIRNYILKSHPDVVHIHMSYKGSFFRKYQIHKLCKKHNIPVVIHLHGSEFKKWYDSSSIKEEIKTLLRECSRVIVLGEKWNETILNIEPKAKTFVISNTVSIPAEITKYNIPFNVLYMGVLIKRKGVSDLIEGINYLKNTNRLENIKVTIAGTGEEEAELKRKCSEYNLDNYIEFKGWISGQQKEALYKNCQMLVLPSYNEGLPMSILEAMSYGMPVVSTNVGDISSAVKNGENGYLFDPGNISEMADAIYKIGSDNTLFDKLSRTSRKMAQEKFSDKDYFINIANMYFDLAGR